MNKQTHLAHYPDKYSDLELRYSSHVISQAGLHIKLGKLLAAALCVMVGFTCFISLITDESGDRITQIIRYTLFQDVQNDW